MKNQKVIDVFAGVVQKVKELTKEYDMTHDEYQEFVHWLDKLGRSGEIPLFLDVFLETHVLQTINENMPGTEPSLLGPYFIEEAATLEKPYVIPQREDEKGDVLFFSGSLRNLDGEPLANVAVDFWQADADGLYSHFAPGIPDFNLRGKFSTDENGNFEVKTVVPGPYGIPTDGPTGNFLGWIDHHNMRPAHLHIKFMPEGFDKLITQVYFEEDPYLEDDVAEGVRSSLITKLVKHDDPADYKEKGLDKPYYTAHLDFNMRLVEKAALVKN